MLTIALLLLAGLVIAGLIEIVVDAHVENIMNIRETEREELAKQSRA